MSAARAVVAAATRFLARAGEAPAAHALERLRAQPLPPNPHAPDARRLPACRFLPEAVAETMLHDASLAAALAMVEDELSWRQNVNYSDAAMGQPGYMAAYAYAEIVGPNGPLQGDDFLLGLMILGPGLHYPDHAHPAPELYAVLSGDSAWSRAGGPFEDRPPGSVVWHGPGVVHATRTGVRPLLALYIWTEAVAEPARLVRAGT
jgi:quercetin dioxygenase-like cupin family protein